MGEDQLRTTPSPATKRNTPRSWAAHRLLFARYNQWLADRLRPFLSQSSGRQAALPLSDAKRPPFVTGRRLWEVRCGQGHLTEWLLDRDFVLATDASAENLIRLQVRLGHPANVSTLQGDITDIDVAELRRYTFDTALCANTLEHLEDDGAALDRIWSALPAGGSLVVLTAAFSKLFNALDRGAGHVRRYNRQSLLRLLAAHGFRVRRSFYVNSLSLPGWWIRGSLLGQEQPSLAQLRMFDRLAPAWGRIEQRLAIPAGLSLVCVAQRRTTSGAIA